MQTPTNLSRYWINKRWAIKRFLAEASYDPNDLKQVIEDWFDAITKPAGGAADSVEDRYDKKLGELLAAWKDASALDSGEQRRSARLVRMVQNVVGKRERGRGFFSEVGEVYSADVVDIYKMKVRETAAAAAAFLKALEDDNDSLAVAIKDLLENNPAINPVVWEAVKSLLRAIRGVLAKQPGSGDGSGPWPSLALGSSSSTSGG